MLIEVFLYLIQLDVLGMGQPKDFLFSYCSPVEAESIDRVSRFTGKSGPGDYTAMIYASSMSYFIPHLINDS